MRRRLFGLTLATDFEFETPLPLPSPAQDAEEPDLVFRCTPAPPVEAESTEPGAWGSDPRDADTDAAAPSFSSPIRLESGAPLLVIRKGPREDLIRFSEVADFRVGDRHIHCQLLDPDYAFTVEIHLLGLVMAYWFERKGIPMLHASAVEVQGHAVGFMASNRGGKSSLAATFVEAGHPLLTDDLLGIQEGAGRFLGRPGYPSMRMWPDQAARFVEDWAELPLAHPWYAKRKISVGPDGFGSFVDRPLPLACCYLPERRDDVSAVEFEPVPPGEAVIEMVRGSFLSRAVEGLELARERLPLLGRIAGELPLRRLVYPDGFEHLPKVRHAIVADLRSLTDPASAASP
jgi:hypothetical protein